MFSRVLHSLLIILFTLCCVGVAQIARAETIEIKTPDRPTDIMQNWRFQAGDDLNWATPNLDDSGWSQITLTQNWTKENYQKINGFSWFRITLRFPKVDAQALSDSPLGITVGSLEYSSYQIYANGRLIGSFGAMPPTPYLVPARLQTFSIPTAVISPDGNINIAIRLWHEPGSADRLPVWAPMLPITCAVGPYLTLQDAVELKEKRAMMGDLPRLVLTCLFALVGIYQLQLYSRRRQLKEYLWFGIIALGATGNTLFLSPWTDGVMLPHVSYAIGFTMLHITVVCWIQFLWRLFGWRVPIWLRVFQIAHIVLAVFSLLTPKLVIAHLGNIPVWMLTPTLLIWLTTIPLEAWRGNPDARTMLVGVLLLALTRFYQLLGVFELIPKYSGIHWGFAALILSVTLSLSNRFNRVYSQLDSLNQDLENKIAQRTAELHETVEQLQSSEKQAQHSREAAVEANRAKSVFLANMSHELRTPLNAILGFVQLMKRNRALDSESFQHLNVIARSGEHLLVLINDILSISKIEAGQIKLNAQDFDLRQMLKGLADIFRMRVEAKGLILVFELSAELPRYVCGDEGKIRQMLINLLENALKFTEDGSISLHAGWQAGRISFDIIDTGFGISAEDMQKLFGVFSQTESGKRAKEGTGLGLSISRNFARLMGGDISVQSELGKGTQFHIEFDLPTATSAVETSIPKQVVGLAEGQPSRRILVTDDVVENRQLLSALMRAVGFIVREASNGKEAVTIWAEWQPDLIWMDMRMPIMDGREATKLIREQEQARVQATSPNQLQRNRTVIIAITASAFEHEKEQILAAGCDDFVPKPFQEHVLFDKLIEYLKVEFVYQDPTEIQLKEVVEAKSEASLNPVTLEDLPARWLERLHEALAVGAIHEAIDIINEVRTGREALADRLLQRVKNYEFEEILQVLETFQQMRAHSAPASSGQ